MEKNYLLRNIFLFGIIHLILIGSINANFVCGEVKDASDNQSASWYNVRLFYNNDFWSYTNCQVSPDGNKYCCDADGLPPFNTWKIGSIVSAEIFDTKTGYFTERVSTKTTGESYDLLPQIKLIKAINVVEPSQKIEIFDGKNSLFFVNFSNQYSNVKISNSSFVIFSCASCTNFSTELNWSFGRNELFIQASDADNRSFDQTLEYNVLQYAKLSRTFGSHSFGEKIESSSNFSVNLFLNLSDSVSGILLKEFVPNTWKVFGVGEGIFQNYDENYNVILWNVSGKENSFSYDLQSPGAGFFPDEYLFESYLEDISINNESVVVYSFFPYFASGGGSSVSVGSLTDSPTFRISPDQPLVLDFDNSPLIRVAVFPSEEFFNAQFELSEADFSSLENLIGAYSYNTNLYSESIDRIGIEFKLNKSFLEEKNYSGVKIFSIGTNFSEGNLTIYKEDESTLFYRGFVDFQKGFVILGYNENSSEDISETLFDKLTGFAIFDKDSLENSFLFRILIRIKEFILNIF